MIFRLGVWGLVDYRKHKGKRMQLKDSQETNGPSFFLGVVTCVRSRLHTMNWSINPDTERTKTFGLGFEQISS